MVDEIKNKSIKKLVHIIKYNKPIDPEYLSLKNKEGYAPPYNMMDVVERDIWKCSYFVF